MRLSGFLLIFGCIALSACASAEAGDGLSDELSVASPQSSAFSSQSVKKLQPLGVSSSSSSEQSSVEGPYLVMADEESSSLDSSGSSESSFILPSSVLLDVPFTSQAPHRNWNEPYQNACEETSFLLVQRYLQGRGIDGADDANNSIVWLTDVVARNGYGVSISLAQLEVIIESVDPTLDAMIETDVTHESLKRFLAEGHPLIVPAAGKRLENPYFTGGGPYYHMLVLIGYDETSYITHDVGTGMGERYAYDQQLFHNAIHDWVGKDELIEQGPKQVMRIVRHI